MLPWVGTLILGTTIKSSLGNIPLREWPLNAAFVALIWILGLKHAQNTKTSALLLIKLFKFQK